MKKQISAGLLSAVLLFTGCEKITNIAGLPQAGAAVPTAFSGMYKVTEGANTYTALVARSEDGVWEISPSDPPELAGMSVRMDTVFGENGPAQTRAEVYFNGLSMSARTVENSTAARVTAAVDMAVINPDTLKKSRQKDGSVKLYGENVQIILDGEKVLYIRAGDAEFSAAE